MELIAPHSYIGVHMSLNHYEAVKNMIPNPSYINSYYGINSSSIDLVYLLDGVLTSSKQFRWINSIKCYFENKVKVPVTWIDEFYITDTTESSGIIYTLKELSMLFGEYDIQYPDLYFTNDNDLLYRHICMNASKLYYFGIMHVEGVYAGALKLVEKVPQNIKTPNAKALWGMSKKAVEHIHENSHMYKRKLDKKALASALSNGGQKRALQKKAEALKLREKVFGLSKNQRFVKKNQKPSPSLIAKELDISRETASRILNSKAYTHKTIA